jgi:Domain of unknown function (DUF4403)
MDAREIGLMTRPRKAGRHFALLTLGALILASWACRREKLAPSAPRATGPWLDTLPPVPTSYLDVPVRYNLAPALQWFEATVPRTVGDINDRRPVPGKKRMHYAFHLERQPFQVRIEGRTATVVAPIRYQGRVWYDPPVLPEISASCGVGDTRPRARVAIVSNVELTENWTLKPRTRALAEPLTAGKRDRCKVTVLRIDVTDKVLAAARAVLQKELTDFDQRVACFDLQAEAQKVWDVLQSPLRLTDSLWLAIDPRAVRIGLLKVEGDTLVTTVGLSANPRIVGGPRPPRSERPMPAAEGSATQPPALHLLTEARVPYDIASVILTRELSGTKIRAGNRTLVVRRLRLSGVGDGQVAVGLTVTGAVDGTLYAVGHPTFDAATAELFMPDLAYDIGTRNVLVGALSWLAQGTIEDFLRTRVRIKMGHIIEQGRELLERNLNRELVSGVHLRATVGAGRVLGVRAAPDALLARAVASGQGELVLDLKPEGPRPQLGKRPRAAQCP